MQEAGLYDYVLCNDSIEGAVKQLLSIAQRALSGQTGNGTATAPLTLVQEAAAQVRQALLALFAFCYVDSCIWHVHTGIIATSIQTWCWIGVITCQDLVTLHMHQRVLHPLRRQGKRHSMPDTCSCCFIAGNICAGCA